LSAYAEKENDPAAGRHKLAHRPARQGVKKIFLKVMPSTGRANNRSTVSSRYASVFSVSQWLMSAPARLACLIFFSSASLKNRGVGCPFGRERVGSGRRLEADGGFDDHGLNDFADPFPRLQAAFDP
jgi:hypothetical protein